MLHKLIAQLPQGYFLRLIIIIFIFSGLNSAILAAPLPKTKSVSQQATMTAPGVCATSHNLGNMRIAMQNNGLIALAYEDETDCFTGERSYIGCEFPKDGLIENTYVISLWMGAVVGRDTLVSTGIDGWGGNYVIGSLSGLVGREFYPDDSQPDGFEFRSVLDTNKLQASRAVSEQDILCTYTDTLKGVSEDFVRSRPHIPINVEVQQRSFVWSYEYAEDMILVDLSLTNIGKEKIEDFYLGIYVDGDVGLSFKARTILASDDVCGFLDEYYVNSKCGLPDITNIAWIADADGDPVNQEYLREVTWTGFGFEKSALDLVGTTILQAPVVDAKLSFNWWISSTSAVYDFGPRTKDNIWDFRTGGSGTPEGDLNKYLLMSNGEFDYDQAFTGVVTSIDPNWEYPPQAVAGRYAKGFDTRYLFSYGPFTIHPGNSLPLSFGVIGGEEFHSDPRNIDNLPDNPREYYNNLDFSDLAKNAMWAKWIYDNPGFDTDGDGYRGRFRVCVHDSLLSDSGWVATVADTEWYEGDGIPDWRAAVPPTPPKFWIRPAQNGIHVRFNGSHTENERDPLTNIVDFEGYHVWMGRDDREDSYSLMASYDIENYDKYVWDENSGTLGNFLLDDIPFSLERVRCAYGLSCDDESFWPLDYTRGSPYFDSEFPDSIFYFVPHHYNAGIGAITKVYPDAQRPPSYIHPDSLDQNYYTAEGNFKYYEYEFTIENLLPTVPYYVNVTAFDFGSPRQGLQPLETSKILNAESTYPFSGDEHDNEQELTAYVYPNPYRKDGDYRDQGYEGRSLDMLPDDKVRNVHFANLPAKCWISVFSLDGDLIRKLRHDYDYDDPNRFHETWDLINRNRQIIVSGLYYWTVESDDGRVQIGKLVILM